MSKIEKKKFFQSMSTQGVPKNPVTCMKNCVCAKVTIQLVFTVVR